MRATVDLLIGQLVLRAVNRGIFCRRMKIYLFMLWLQRKNVAHRAQFQRCAVLQLGWVSPDIPRGN